MTSLLVLDAAVTLPILVLGAIMIAGMHLNGVLTDKLAAELQLPFSRATLMVVGGVMIIFQLLWISARLAGTV
jgi:hypothetical protein